MHQILASIGARKRLAITLIAALAATLFAIQIAGSASAATKHRTKHHAHTSGGQGSATGLGQLSGFLPTDKLTLESAIDVNLNNETVRLPIYPGTAPVPGNPSQTETGVVHPRRRLRSRDWRTIWASTTRRNWPTLESATRPPCKRSPRTTPRLRPIRSDQP